MDVMNVNKGYPVFERYYSVSENNVLENVDIYPNPTKNFVTISGENLSKIEIFNITGQMVLNFDYTNDNQTIDLVNLYSGIYFFKIIDKNGNHCTKKVVKH